MKNIITVFGAIFFASSVFTSCGGSKTKSNQPNSDTIKNEGTVEKPKSDSKETIRVISEKFYIPLDESKANYIFTINQNLNLQLLNYKSSFEGKYVDGKIQFDDKNATTIDFKQKGENLILKNQNDIEVEFRLASENEILSGTWIYKLPPSTYSFPMIFDKKGNWNCPDDVFGPTRGQYKSKGNRKYSIIHYNNNDDLQATLTVNTPITFILNYQSAIGTENVVHTRSQKAKLQSLNQIFN